MSSPFKPEVVEQMDINLSGRNRDHERLKTMSNLIDVNFIRHKVIDGRNMWHMCELITSDHDERLTCPKLIFSNILDVLNGRLTYIAMAVLNWYLTQLDCVACIHCNEHFDSWAELQVHTIHKNHRVLWYEAETHYLDHCYVLESRKPKQYEICNYAVSIIMRALAIESMFIINASIKASRHIKKPSLYDKVLILAVPLAGKSTFVLANKDYMDYDHIISSSHGWPTTNEWFYDAGLKREVYLKNGKYFSTHMFNKFVIGHVEELRAHIGICCYVAIVLFTKQHLKRHSESRIKLGFTNKGTDYKSLYEYQHKLSSLSQKLCLPTYESFEDMDTARRFRLVLPSELDE